jgi:hypothetical protein
LLVEVDFGAGDPSRVRLHQLLPVVPELLATVEDETRVLFQSTLPGPHFVGQPQVYRYVRPPFPARPAYLPPASPLPRSRILSVHAFRVTIDPQTGEKPWSFLLRRSPDEEVTAISVTILDETTGVQYGPEVLAAPPVEPVPEPDPDEPPPDPVPDPAPTHAFIVLAGSGQTAEINTQLPVRVQVEVRDAITGALLVGEPTTWTPSHGGSVVDGQAATGTVGRTRADWVLGGTAGKQTLRLETSSGLLIIEATATDPATPPPPPPPPPPPDPPPPGATNITPADLQGAIGSLVARGTTAPGWPANFEAHLDDAIDRMVSEVASGSYTAIPDVPDGDNPHYGPLRMVVMRNIRAGLPLDETEPGFAAALKITREWVRQYAIPGGNRLTLYRNTALIDCEIVYWLYKDDPGDNGLLATQCRQFLQVASAWLSTITAPAYKALNHHWMDSRPIALAIEAALAAERVGWAFTATGSPGYNPHNQTQYKPAGVTSWATYLAHVNSFIDAVQAASVAQFGGQADRAGHTIPAVAANLHYAVSADWTDPAQFVVPYPWKPFMDAMVANALLKAYRQHASAASLQNAVELAVGALVKYDQAAKSRKALPYSSDGAGPSVYFYDNDTDYALNNFWPRPLLELYQETGTAAYRDVAVGLLEASCNGGGGVANANNNWLWRFKQAQQLASATEPQSAQALLAGVSA